MRILIGPVFMLCICLVCGDKLKTVTCGALYNLTSGVVHYSNGSSESVDKNINCAWTFKFNETKGSEEVFLVLEDFFLEADDTLTLQKNVSGTLSPLNIGPFKGAMGLFMVLTGAPSVTVTLKTSDKDFKRKFQLRYFLQLKCEYNLTNTMTGTVLSPYYEANRTANVTCSLNINMSTQDSFKLNVMLLVFNISDNLNLAVSETEKFDGNYQGASIPPEFISDKKFGGIMNLKPNGKFLEQIIFTYQAVNRECSGTEELIGSGKSSVTVANPKSTEASAGHTPSLNCRTLVFTKDDVAGLSVSVNSHHLAGVMDQMLVTNGTKYISKPLLQFTSDNEKDWEDQYILTNDKKVSVSIVSPFLSPDLNTSVTVSLLNYGGYFEGSGDIEVSGQKAGVPAVFLLRVDPQKQVKLDLTSKELPKKGTLEFYYNFEKVGTPFAELSETTTTVISPSHMMMVIANGFTAETFQAKFDSIDRGCFAISTDDNVGSYSVFGKCSPICAWTMAANANKTAEVFQRKLHFSSLFLNANDSLRVVQDGKSTLLNLTGPLRHLDDILVLSNQTIGVVLTRDCNSTGASLVADYATNPKCVRNVTLSPGQSRILSSPGFPNGYAVGTQCKWFFGVREVAVLHLEFLSLNLGSDKHRLFLYDLKGTGETLIVQLNGRNTTLPRDYVVSGNLSVFFEAPTFNFTSLDTVNGFHMKITAADCGGEMLVNATGSFGTPPGKKAGTTDIKSCAWIVGIDGSGKDRRILQYNVTAGGDVKGVLDIYEGSSVHDSLSPNLTGINLLSRGDHLLILYNATTSPGPSVNVSYKAEACNSTLMCKNGVCMHLGWRCDGKNDCGDWSDELHCCIEPTPAPSPLPPPGPKGVSNVALALGILAALLIGALLGFGAPAAYRRIRTGQFGSNYSSFSNSADA